MRLCTLTILLLATLAAAQTQPKQAAQPKAAEQPKSAEQPKQAAQPKQPKQQKPFVVGQPVRTYSGTAQGRASPWKKDVSEYLGIPFAQPPVGPNRFMPPVLLKKNQQIQATKYPPSCPANIITPNGTIPYDRGFGATLLASVGQVGNRFDEDCLALNIWTKPQTGEKKKAVMIWIYGGGFNSGSSDNDMYNGARLADEHDVIVVSINYRTNIFGFPRAGFLPELNLGLLDQRLAVEWLWDNIEKFGGDQKRMILFGQSAGGMSVDYYSYAWRDDAIINGFISESGSASMPVVKWDDPNIDEGWYTASQKLGCGGRDAGNKTLECMQSKPWQAISDAIEKRKVSPNTGANGFGPVADGIIVFSDYARKNEEGEFIPAPLLVGNTANEGSFYQLLGAAFNQPGASAPKGPTPDPLAASGGMMGCGPHGAAAARRKHGVNAWRYVYAGEYPNQDIGYRGSWHMSEIGPVFGTTEYLSHIKDTKEEEALGLAMRRAWTGFAKDPANFLADQMKWPVYDETKPSVIRLGGPNSSEVVFEAREKYDAQCPKSVV